MNEDIQIRSYTEDDKDFIFDSWLQSYKDSLFARRIIWSVYKPNHSTLIQRILDRKAVVRIAHFKGDSYTILGYLVFEGTKESPVIHYMYVKEPFRRMGIAKTLCDGLNLDSITFTHFTDIAHWLQKKYSTARYVPYAV